MRHNSLVLFLLIVSLIINACQFNNGTVTPTATTVPTRAAIVATAVPTAGAMAATRTPSTTPTLTPTPTITPSTTPTPSPTATLTVTPTPEKYVPHYMLARPIADGGTNEIDRTYPYGSTQDGRRSTHHGVEFVNPRGTPVLAAANGVIVYAGEDTGVIAGPRPDYYGLVVIIEHGFSTPDGQPVYTLYGHLDRIDVETGQTIEQGDRVGIVGDRGIAIGPHLHFEVRTGDDPFDFYATQNPDLWIFPFPNVSTLVGRVTGPDGLLAQDVTVQLRRSGVSGPAPYFTYTYADESVNSTYSWEENFTRGDLRPGEYEVFVTNGSGRMLGEALVELEAGQTIWVEIQLERLPPSRPTSTPTGENGGV